MTPYYADESVTLHLGRCEDVLPSLPPESVDAIVTDPPAAIAFMGREWDSNLGGRDRWVAWLADCMEKAARVLKPGGHLLVWSLPRTSGWTQWALEDAGLEIRDCIVHLFGSGFPKSLNVSVAIDKLKRRDYVLAAIRLGLEVPGNNLHDWTKAEHSPGDEWWGRFKAHLAPEDWQRLEREVTGHGTSGRTAGMQQLGPSGIKGGGYEITAAATEDAADWAGWGTALKPGQEMWWLARKPLSEGTVAANVLEFGTGALNIAACKVAHASDADQAESEGKNRHGDFGSGPRQHNGVYQGQPAADRAQYDGSAGRWPTNIVFTHSAACEPLGVREVRSDGHHPATRGTGGLGTSGHAGQDGLAERKSGTEAVTAWACAPDCPVGELDRQSGVLASGKLLPHHADHGKVTGTLGAFAGAPGRESYGDTGGASRFYPTFRYQAKAPASERPRLDDGTAHETVKSLGLMSWLVRLITPPGGTVLDLFAGSGPTGEACIIEGFRCVLIEQNPKSAELIKTRLAKPIQPTLFGDVA